MRILMVVRDSYSLNPYVMSLKDGLNKLGHEVVSGLNLFWDSFENYDLVFFQWPEEIFEWRQSEIDIEKLSNHFERIITLRIKTVVTCHNLHPHNNDAKTMALYDLVYSKVDAFHHLGRYSYYVMKDRYPHQYHFIAPHHIADSLWKNPICSSEAKKQLHISKNRIVVSSFGAFRNSDEVWLFLNMAIDVFTCHVAFLAHRIPIGHFNNGLLIKQTIKYLMKSLLYKMMRIKYSGYLTEEELNLWLHASDVVFIQRKEILNSGNLPLAFSAGKVVVGPDVGNVGEILRETGNFVFDPANRRSVKVAMMNAIHEVKNNNLLGKRNSLYAKENWSTSSVCKLIDKEIRMIMKNNNSE